jgi:hypothetical protein
LVPNDVPFLNADNIARELAPEGNVGSDLTAGRLLLRRAEVKRNRASFAVETNLANRTPAARIPRWQEAGRRVRLFYIWLPSADMAVARVAQRVRSGGHDIPETTIRRRYDSSENNEAVPVARGVVRRRGMGGNETGGKVMSGKANAVERTFEALLDDEALTDRLAREAVWEALRRHKRLGQEIVVWRDGKVVIMPPEEIDVPEEATVAET